jgi:hypothetical protein
MKAMLELCSSLAALPDIAKWNTDQKATLLC